MFKKQISATVSKRGRNVTARRPPPPLLIGGGYPRPERFLLYEVVRTNKRKPRKASGSRGVGSTDRGPIARGMPETCASSGNESDEDVPLSSVAKALVSISRRLARDTWKTARKVFQSELGLTRNVPALS